MNKYFSEFLGTFALVFAGTGAIIINDVSGGAVTHLGVALTFGLIIMVMIYALGDISGAHFNPAVSFGFFLAKRLSLKELLVFFMSQTAGAITASGILKGIFPQHQTLGATFPRFISPESCFLFEIILTYFLMFVILQVAHGAKEKGLMAGVAIGGTVALEAIFAGPVTGASMNPARSLAPAIISGNFNSIWIYLVAPFIGVVFAILTYSIIKESISHRA